MENLKICPSCGVEYRAIATRCSDCDVVLVDASQGRTVLAAGPAFPPAEQLESLGVLALVAARRISNVLSEAGIPHRLEQAEAPGSGDDGSPVPLGRNFYCAVLVRAEDLERARALCEEGARDELKRAGYEVEPAGFEEGRCPACGAPLGEADETCASCGLDFTGRGALEVSAQPASQQGGGLVRVGLALLALVLGWLLFRQL